MLSKGEIVAVPTETVYGLAANIFHEDAITQLFKVKNRPFNDPLIVHIHSLEQLESIAHIPETLYALSEQFWPGPLTVILQKKSSVSDRITANKNTVAVRMPSHPLLRKILQSGDLALAAPSANPFGYVSPTTADHVYESFGKTVPHILDGGKAEFGLESTVLNLTSDIPTILRPGPITKKEISETLNCTVHDHAENSNSCPNNEISPGLLPQHYSPNTKLILFKDVKDLEAKWEKSTGNKIAVFLKPSTESKAFRSNNTCVLLSPTGNIKEAGAETFSILRKLDQQDLSTIFFEESSNDGIGIAINDRLSRAANQT